MQHSIKACGYGGCLWWLPLVPCCPPTPTTLSLAKGVNAAVVCAVVAVEDTLTWRGGGTTDDDDDDDDDGDTDGMIVGMAVSESSDECSAALPNSCVVARRERTNIL